MAGEIYFNNLTGKFDWGSIIDQIIRIKSLPLQRLSLLKVCFTLQE